ncbi:ESPR-type extended signal peptide-containing protein, partial [Haemophilus haemolyticus]|uniref:ESPR-type extended signal peptide-containing protein n=1 Tax=Haemophilus haemolyticus TaxID=726 RepID=UPI0012902140
MNKIFRIVWSEVSQAWIAVSELTKSHKKRASATAVAVALVAGMLSPFAEASNTESDPAKNLEPSELGTDYYFRVTTANTGEPDDLEHYNGCRNGNADSACPDTEMNIGVLDKDSAPTEDNSDNSRLVLEGNKGIRLKKAEDKSHKITFDAPVEVADGSGAVSIEQPVTGDKAGHTIIKSEIKSGSPDKIQVESANGETTITWVGGDTAGGGAGGGTPVTAGDGISVSADNKVSVNAKTDGGIKVDGDGVSVNAKTDGGIKVDGDGVSVDVDGKTIEVGTDGKVTAKVASAKGLEKTDDGLAIKSKTNGGLTVDADGVSVNAKANGGLTVDGSGVSVNTDGTTITVDTATGNVKAVTGDFNVNAATGATEANKNDANKLATVGNVASAINAAKVKVVAGNGAEVAHDAKTNTYTVSAKVEDNKGLVAGTNGLSVQGGNGVTVDNNGVSVNAKANGGITVDASGVSVNAKADGGLTVGADGVSVNAKNNGGIKVDGDGVSVDVDGKTIEVGTDGKVTAKVASAKGLEKTDDGLAIKSKTN